MQHLMLHAMYQQELLQRSAARAIAEAVEQPSIREEHERRSGSTAIEVREHVVPKRSHGALKSIVCHLHYDRSKQ